VPFGTPLVAALVSLGAIGFATPAAAQNQSPWAGLYVGINAGGAWSNSDADAVLSTNPGADITPPDGTEINNANVKGHLSSGHHNTFTIGGEVGYNYVMSHGLLLGIETDFGMLNISRSRTQTVGVPAVNPTRDYSVFLQAHTDWLWTLRPRIGYTTGKFLVFASGGLALTHVYYHAHFDDSADPSNAIRYDHGSSRTGWTLGGGLGYAITPRISVKGEYLYEDFGTNTNTTTSTNGLLNLTTETNLKSHLFRAGVDYRF
jgi:outer membrane immunogenic protein